MKKTIYILIILILGISSCQNVDSLVDSIAKRNIIECEGVGFGSNPSRVYKKFKKLKRKASNEELTELLNHDSIAVVGYSAYAILDKEIIKPFKLFERLLHEDKYVKSRCGCTSRWRSLPYLVYQRYWNKGIESQRPSNINEAYKVNDSKVLQKMDSLILFTEKSDLILVGMALKNRIYPDEYHSQIENWAYEEKDFHALKYVFKNLLKGNKEKLEITLNEYLKKETVYDTQREEINQILKELKKES
jgi:hypothetical protein